MKIFVEQIYANLTNIQNKNKFNLNSFLLSYENSVGLNITLFLILVKLNKFNYIKSKIITESKLIIISAINIIYTNANIA